MQPGDGYFLHISRFYSVVVVRLWQFIVFGWFSNAKQEWHLISKRKCIPSHEGLFAFCHQSNYSSAYNRFYFTLCCLVLHKYSIDFLLFLIPTLCDPSFIKCIISCQFFNRMCFLLYGLLDMAQTLKWIWHGLALNLSFVLKFSCVITSSYLSRG